ncbi:hypothetical protein [Streptomyces peucetius]|uniref:Gram-positive cocci surface proteins LPxTG domain-containing protein n=1 Tax=Streptomyces peucetius TaxID=1950 RepID=A0ABY6I2T7_STRPE|nr:hypothetical protein [Streptomyces peucetius]UYQ61289.1 hypothetical protein OGH68_07260 [Streptomyces peucetius]
MSTTATLRPRRVRTGAAALAVLAYAGVTLAGAPAAFAQPGDSGDLKIHKAGVPHWDTRDDVKGVCKFSLSAFNFESLDLLEWRITPQPPTASGPTLNDSIALIAGRGHTEEYALPDGDYLLTWTIPGPPPETKQKVFTVDCDKYGEKKGDKIEDERNGSDWSKGDKGSPHGAVPAGGGGMADDAGTGGGDDGSSVGMTTALVAGAAGLAGMVAVRRARRRAHGAA